MALTPVQSDFTIVPVSERGAFNSKDYNTTLETMAATLTSIAQQWNAYLQPLLGSLPTGGFAVPAESRTTDINPFINGLDGTQLYLDSSALSSSDEGRYYSTDLARPLTVKEVTEALYLKISDEIASIDAILSQIDTATGLTAAQKERIGDNIFDTTLTSLSGSLDYNVALLLDRVNQLAADVWNAGGDVGDSNTYTWSGGSVQTKAAGDTIVDRLDQIEVDIVGLVTAPVSQTQVANTGYDSSINDSYTGSPTNLIGDLNRLRNRVKTLAGTASWTTDATDPVTASAGSLSTHINYLGSGTADADNPHGLDVADLDDTTGVFTDIDTSFSIIDNALSSLAAAVGLAWDPSSLLFSLYTFGGVYLSGAMTVIAALEALDTALDGVADDVASGAVAITDLQNDVSSLQSAGATLTATSANHESRLDELEAEVSDRLVNCTTVEAPNGVRTQFTVAYQAAEAIPLPDEYGFPANALASFEVGVQILDRRPPSFTHEDITTEITGRLPAYPGEFLVIYDATVAAAISGTSVGEVYFFTSATTITDAGYFIFTTPLLTNFELNSAEVHLTLPASYAGTTYPMGMTLEPFVHFEEIPDQADQSTCTGIDFWHLSDSYSIILPANTNILIHCRADV